MSNEELNVPESDERYVPYMVEGEGNDHGLQVVTMAELKQQMRVDFEDEDTVIGLYGKAAEDSIINMTRRSLEELIAVDGTVPARLKLAILILAAHFYRNREPVAGVAQNPVPYSIAVLVKPFVKLSERE